MPLRGTLTAPSRGSHVAVVAVLSAPRQLPARQLLRCPTGSTVAPSIAGAGSSVGCARAPRAAIRASRLGLVELVVEAAAREQLLVRALLDEAAVVR